MFGSHGPEKSRRGKFWEKFHPALGKSIEGWLAGPIVGLDTHFLNRTLPCLRDITRGQLECDCVRMKLIAEWKGYVPIWNADGVKGFCIISERAWDVACKIPIFAPVSITREKWKGQPIFVREERWTQLPPPFEPRNLVPLDMKAQLLKIWDIPDLTEFLANNPDLRDQAVVDLHASAGHVPAVVNQRAKMKPAKGQPGTLNEVMASLPVMNGKKPH